MWWVNLKEFLEKEKSKFEQLWIKQQILKFPRDIGRFLHRNLKEESQIRKDTSLTSLKIDLNKLRVQTIFSCIWVMDTKKIILTNSLKTKGSSLNNSKFNSKSKWRKCNQNFINKSQSISESIDNSRKRIIHSRTSSP